VSLPGKFGPGGVKLFHFGRATRSADQPCQPEREHYGNPAVIADRRAEQAGGVIMLGVAGGFAYESGWLSLDRLTRGQSST
jgi:hypothetical protein